MNEKRAKRMRKFAWSVCEARGCPDDYKKVYRAIKKGFRNERRMAGFNPPTN